jgi:hypothetical protein
VSGWNWASYDLARRMLDDAEAQCAYGPDAAYAWPALAQATSAVRAMGVDSADAQEAKRLLDEMRPAFIGTVEPDSIADLRNDAARLAALLRRQLDDLADAQLARDARMSELRRDIDGIDATNRAERERIDRWRRQLEDLDGEA